MVCLDEARLVGKYVDAKTFELERQALANLRSKGFGSAVGKIARHGHVGHQTADQEDSNGCLSSNHLVLQTPQHVRWLQRIDSHLLLHMLSLDLAEFSFLHCAGSKH